MLEIDIFRPAGATFMERNSPSPKVSATMQAIFSLATFGVGVPRVIY